jgi:hypothetical protein
MPVTAPSVSVAETPAELFSSLQAAKIAADAKAAESTFLVALPIRLSIWGGLFAYGMASGKTWAKWAGGAALAFTGVEYFAARRRAELAAAAATTVPQQGALAP